MGQYMKDGSYQYDSSDEKVFEHGSQKEEYRLRQERIRAEEIDRKWKTAKAEKERDEREKREQAYRDELREKEEDAYRKETRILEGRKNAVIYWKNINSWSKLINKVNGKSKKLSALIEQYNNAQTNEEKTTIIVQMEKLFPELRKQQIEREQRRISR